MASNPEMTLQVKQRCLPVKKAGQTNRLLTPEMSGDHWKRLFNFSSEITVKTNDLKLHWIKTNIEKPTHAKHENTTQPNIQQNSKNKPDPIGVSVSVLDYAYRRLLLVYKNSKHCNSAIIGENLDGYHPPGGASNGIFGTSRYFNSKKK